MERAGCGGLSSDRGEISEINEIGLFSLPLQCYFFLLGYLGGASGVVLRWRQHASFPVKYSDETVQLESRYDGIRTCLPRIQPKVGIDEISLPYLGNMACSTIYQI